MPRILAIDWDRQEVRAVLLNSGPTGTSVAGAWVAPLETSEGSGLTGKEIGERLAGAIGDQSLNKVTTIVGVGRDSVQMKLLNLPPAPPSELADMVRFQAEREFTALGDDAALDYIPLAGDATTPFQVLTVALSAAGMAEARDICQAVGVEPNRITLRASAAASLVSRAGVVESSSVALVVNPFNDEADLTVLSDDQPVLTRTVRLPDASQDEVRQRTLLSEIRRTLAAVRQQLDRQVEQIFICGDERSAAHVDELATKLENRIAQFNPIDQAPAGLDRHAIPADSLTRFAAVLGMATSEVDRRPPALDFLNVRRAVVERRFTRSHMLAAVGAVAAVLMIAVFLWNQGAALDRQLASLRQQNAELVDSVRQAEEFIAKADAVDRWLEGDITWLDTLEQLSRRLRPEPMDSNEFPVSTDVMATQLTMFRPPQADDALGRIDLKLVGKSAAAMDTVERRVRDQRHQVSTSGWQADTTHTGYGVAFDLNIGLIPADEEATP